LNNFDCSEGCNLSEGTPVCGADGNTYFNECLAFCQDTEIDHAGTCQGRHQLTFGGDLSQTNGKEGDILTYATSEDPFYIHEGLVSMKTMKRFKDGGFKYVARRKRTRFGEDEENKGIRSIHGLRKGTVRAARLTSEGDEYVSDAIDVSNDEGRRVQSTTFIDRDEEVDHENDSHRGLAILGEDTRTKVSRTDVWPYNVVGSLFPSWLNKGCTATVVSKTSILTVLHCLYNQTSQTWMDVDKFAPARYRTSSGEIVDPYGVWDVDYVTVYKDHLNDGNSDYEFGIVRL